MNHWATPHDQCNHSTYTKFMDTTVVVQVGPLYWLDSETESFNSLPGNFFPKNGWLV